MSRIVDQDVEPAELCHCALDKRFAVGFFADVPRDEDGSPARLFDPASGLAGIILLAQVGDQDVGTLAGVRDGDGPPDA